MRNAAKHWYGQHQFSENKTDHVLTIILNIENNKLSCLLEV